MSHLYTTCMYSFVIIIKKSECLFMYCLEFTLTIFFKACELVGRLRKTKNGIGSKSSFHYYLCFKLDTSLCLNENNVLIRVF